MRSLNDYLESGSKPQLISWGIHEGMRGTTWIQLHSNGRLSENRYIPGGSLQGETTELGMLPSGQFDQLLELLLLIPDKYFADDSDLDPHAQITLDCIADDFSWRWAFLPWQIDKEESLSQVAVAIRALKDQLPENGVDGQPD